MNWYLFFYLVSILNAVGTALAWLIALSTVLLIIGLVITISARVSDNFFPDDYDHGSNNYQKGLAENTRQGYILGKRMLWWSGPMFMVFVILQAITPTRKDALLIAAGGAVGEFVSNDEAAKQLPGDVTKWLHAELASATADLNPVTQAEKDKLMAMPQEELVKQLMAEKQSASK